MGLWGYVTVNPCLEQVKIIVIQLVPPVRGKKRFELKLYLTLQNKKRMKAVCNNVRGMAGLSREGKNQ